MYCNFQQGGTKNKPTNSELFTTLGTKSSSVASKLSLKKKQSTESLATAEKSNIPHNTCNPPSTCVNSKISAALEREQIDDKASCKEPIVIPETQLFKSPAGYQQKDKKFDSFSDCEEIIIPDTPEDSKVEAKGKKVFGRSFLTSSAAVGKKPGLTKAEIIQKKRLSRARKSLVSISLNSPLNVAVKESDGNSKADVKGENKEEAVLIDDFEKDSPIVDLEASFDEVTPKVEEESRTKIKNDIGSEDEAVEEMEEENIGSDVENICDSSLNPADAETPTKMYESSIKRMSKTGESPDAKRLPAEEDSENGNDSLSTATCNKESVKRNLSSFKVNEKRKKIKPKVSAVNNYQLTMSVHRKNDRENVSTVNDDVLGELLGELDSKSNSDSLTVFEQNTPLTTLKLKSRKSLSKSLIKSPVLMKTAEISEHEQKLFQSLDKEVHMEFSAPMEVGASDGNESKLMPCTSLSMKLKSSLNACKMVQGTDRDVDIELVGTPPVNSEILPTATQNIKEYASQQLKVPPLVEDIEEFDSQMDDSPCDGLDALSPFKVNDKSSV